MELDVHFNFFKILGLFCSIMLINRFFQPFLLYIYNVQLVLGPIRVAEQESKRATIIEFH